MRFLILASVILLFTACQRDLGQVSRDVGTGTLNILTLGDAGRPRQTDEERCTEYGFTPGTESFANCLLELETARWQSRRVHHCHPIQHYYGLHPHSVRCY